jgi:hypothetical protein
MPVRCSARSEPPHYTEFHFDFFCGELADSRLLSRDSPPRKHPGTQDRNHRYLEAPPVPAGSGRANRGFECVTGRATCAGVLSFYRGLSFLVGQSGEPALNPTANPPVVHIQKADGSGAAALTAGSIVVTTPHTPATSFEVCIAGAIAWGANFVYVCVATNTWRRSALAA